MDFEILTFESRISAGRMCMRAGLFARFSGVDNGVSVNVGLMQKRYFSGPRPHGFF